MRFLRRAAFNWVAPRPPQTRSIGRIVRNSGERRAGLSQRCGNLWGDAKGPASVSGLFPRILVGAACTPTEVATSLITPVSDRLAIPFDEGNAAPHQATLSSLSTQTI